MTQTKPEGNRSEAELFLENFLSNEKIKFHPEKVIRNLSNDEKGFRVADFYLPRYNVYIEFQGLWNNSRADRDRYKEKMRTYYENDVPCIFIYPENLGIIDYVFHVRMLETLKKFDMRSQLIKYKLFRFMHRKQSLLIWFTIFLYSTIAGAEDFEQTTEGSFEESIYMIVLLALFVQFIMLVKAFIIYYIRER